MARPRGAKRARGARGDRGGPRALGNAPCPRAPRPGRRPPPRSETPVPGDRETGLRAGARGPPRNRAPVAQVVLRRSAPARPTGPRERSEEHTSELQSRVDLVCRLLLEKKKRQP